MNLCLKNLELEPQLQSWSYGFEETLWKSILGLFLLFTDQGSSAHKSQR